MAFHAVDGFNCKLLHDVLQQQRISPGVGEEMSYFDSILTVSMQEIFRCVIPLLKATQDAVAAGVFSPVLMGPAQNLAIDCSCCPLFRAHPHESHAPPDP